MCFTQAKGEISKPVENIDEGGRSANGPFDQIRFNQYPVVSLPFCTSRPGEYLHSPGRVHPHTYAGEDLQGAIVEVSDLLGREDVEMGLDGRDWVHDYNCFKKRNAVSARMAAPMGRQRSSMSNRGL